MYEDFAPGRFTQEAIRAILLFKTPGGWLDWELGFGLAGKSGLARPPSPGGGGGSGCAGWAS